jgi:shikimate dehydrogenase
MAIDSHTRLYAVIGNPIRHSLSPLMHNRAFSHIGYNAVYLALPVEDVAGAVAGIRSLGIRGVSVTIPHKVSIMDCLDEIDKTAVRIGAVNTVVNRDGCLYGSNSDAMGAVSALMEQVPIAGRIVTIIGAGGAARAIGFGLIAEGARVKILNRTRKKGEKLARVLGGEFQPLTPTLRLNSDILINTTPVGMTPDAGVSPVPLEALDKEMIVMDIVYNPLKTKLLQDAASIGCSTIDGTAMFVYQGALQFELWTGKKAPVELMRNTVLEALGREHRAESMEHRAGSREHGA